MCGAGLPVKSIIRIADSRSTILWSLYTFATGIPVYCNKAPFFVDKLIMELCVWYTGIPKSKLQKVYAKKESRKMG
jgi:hypothetical protein